MKNYNDVMDWIDSTAQLGWKFSLDRIRDLLHLMGRPQDNLKIVHVAGTNGKGSVVAMTAAILNAAGYLTGMYISPELEDFRERMLVNNRKISEQALISLMNETRFHCEAMEFHPTQFELVTAAAIKYFSDAGCEFVCLETGLGGRTDATNVVTPLVSVITTISLDHTDYLGDTLESIASEKAGIIKEGVPILTGVTDDRPLSVIKDRAQKCSASLVIVGDGGPVTWAEHSDDWRDWRMDVRGPGYSYDGLKIGLLGRHQLQNAALAVATAHKAAELAGLGLDAAATKCGLETVSWPGRMEVALTEPLVLLDGAHNTDGARVLVETLNRIPRNRLICVYGILRAHRDISPLIIPLCDEVILTAPVSDRALEPSVLKEELSVYAKPVSVEQTPQSAMARAIAHAAPDDIVLCCGSLYLVGPVRTYLRSNHGVPEYGK